MVAGNKLRKCHILLAGKPSEDWNEIENIEYKYVVENFFGRVVTSEQYEDVEAGVLNKDKVIIFLCGDVSEFDNFSKINGHINILKNLAFNVDKRPKGKTYYFMNSGAVPINIHNIGVLVRQFVKPEKKYYQRVLDVHELQTMTESTKPCFADRKGIYLTPTVEKDGKIMTRLLRCSSNLGGPTENFREVDNEIVDRVNEIADYCYDSKANLNHVLAQVYFNNYKRKDNGTIAGKKAKISPHTDKTKDMHDKAVIAFCTFYDDFEKYDESISDYFDRCYANISVLTKLRLRLKSDVTDVGLETMIDVLLYPNSVFLIPLSTNRMYTHAIVPSQLSIDKIPTRMGYVVRCSDTQAVYKDNKMWLVEDGEMVELIRPTEEEVDVLKKMYYYRENMTSEIINYEKFRFSLNNGDYMKPTV